MSTRPLRLVALVSLFALGGLAACGGDDHPSLPPLTWTWVPLDGSVCNDGSGTGIGVQKGPGATPNVLVFLDGGGACWDYTTCWVARLATTGPFGPAEFDARIRAAVPGSIFDRTAAGNPYKDFTFVFVPYCTGDVHAGATTQTYAPATQPWHHNGRVNVSKAFEYLKTALDAPAKVVVSGASAGGFGSMLAFTKAKATWPAAKGYLVDDSGPPLPNVPDVTKAAWVLQWDLGTVIADVCGADCFTLDLPPRIKLDPIIPKLANDHPGDRFALLESTQDQTIRSFFGSFTTTFPFVDAMPAQTFQDALLGYAATIDHDGPPPPGETHAFVVPGPSHTMLGHPADFTSQGVPLFEWLRRQVDDDPSWAQAVTP